MVNRGNLSLELVLMSPPQANLPDDPVILHFFFTKLQLLSHALLLSVVCSLLQQVVLADWSSQGLTPSEVSEGVWVYLRRGYLSPELYLTSHSPLLHTPCQQVESYLSPTELSHSVHTWPCHYHVPGFVFALLSPSCVTFLFSTIWTKIRTESIYKPSVRHTHRRSLLSPLFMKEALWLLQRGPDRDLPWQNQ